MFSFNRCADDTLNLYNSLIAKGGEIVTKQGDFGVNALKENLSETEQHLKKKILYEI